MAGNKEMLYLFSTLLKSTPLGGFSKQVDLKLNVTHQLLVYAADDNIFGVSVHTVKKNKIFSGW
jgi:hypothetical protein